jgi:integrase
MIEIDLKQKRGSSKDKALTPQERALLFENFENHDDKKNRIILILGAFGGLRVSEIAQVRKEWLKFTKVNDKEVLEINIPDKDTNLRNQYKDFVTKTKKARTTFIFDLKQAHFIKNVFDYENIAISRQAILKRVRSWNDIIKREKNKLTVHSLRSSATNYFIYELNLAPEFAQICLGHTDIRTTYAHYRSTGKAQALSYLEGKLKNDI